MSFISSCWMITLTAHSSIGRKVTQGGDTALSVHWEYSTWRTQSFLFAVIQEPIRNFLTKPKEDIRQALLGRSFGVRRLCTREWVIPISPGRWDLDCEISLETGILPAREYGDQDQKGASLDGYLSRSRETEKWEGVSGSWGVEFWAGRKGDIVELKCGCQET